MPQGIRSPGLDLQLPIPSQTVVVTPSRPFQLPPMPTSLRTTEVPSNEGTLNRILSGGTALAKGVDDFIGNKWDEEKRLAREARIKSHAAKIGEADVSRASSASSLALGLSDAENQARLGVANVSARSNAARLILGVPEEQARAERARAGLASRTDEALLQKDYPNIFAGAQVSGANAQAGEHQAQLRQQDLGNKLWGDTEKAIRQKAKNEVFALESAWENLQAAKAANPSLDYVAGLSELKQKADKFRAENDLDNEKFKALPEVKAYLRQAQLLGQGAALQGASSKASVKTGGASKPLAEGAEKRVLTLKDGLPDVAEALSYLNSPTGQAEISKHTGWQSKLPENFQAKKSPSTVKFFQTLANLTNEKLHELSGAAIAESEWERLQRGFADPSQWDDKFVASAQNYLSRQYAAGANTLNFYARQHPDILNPITQNPGEAASIPTANAIRDGRLKVGDIVLDRFGNSHTLDAKNILEFGKGAWDISPSGQPDEAPAAGPLDALLSAALNAARGGAPYPGTGTVLAPAQPAATTRQLTPQEQEAALKSGNKTLLPGQVLFQTPEGLKADFLPGAAPAQGTREVDRPQLPGPYIGQRTPILTPDYREGAVGGQYFDPAAWVGDPPADRRAVAPATVKPAVPSLGLLDSDGEPRVFSIGLTSKERAEKRARESISLAAVLDELLSGKLAQKERLKKAEREMPWLRDED